MAHAHSEMFAVDRTLWEKWNMILSHTFLEQEMYEDATDEEREREIYKQWTKFIEEDLLRIDAVLKKEQWIWQPSDDREMS